MLVPMLYLLSSTWTHSCFFPHTQSGYLIARSLKELGLWSISQLVPVKWSLHLKLGVLFRCLLSKVIFLYTKFVIFKALFYDTTLYL